MYVGIAPLYLLSQHETLVIVNVASLVSILPILALAFFTKFFLNICQYKILNIILNIILVIAFLLTALFLYTDEYNRFRNLLPILLFAYLIFLTFYAVFRRNRQAYFILLGWIVIFIAIALMYLSSIGVFDIYQYFPYIVELAFITEAVIFAIALSDKINTLKTNLIVQKRTENERLELLVEEKTKDLNISLEEKTLLLQELNHRVKNNMQMIVSLIRLQTNDIEDKKIQALFITTQNRLNAMSELHELLYKKEDISYINAYEYFTTLIEGLQETYTQDIDINYTIDTDLQTEQAISCGIILNELVTNSLKYAFSDDLPSDKYIDIFLSKFEDRYTLIVKDNGVGYDQEKIKKSFGLILVSTLVESKLQGTIEIDSNHGVETTIIWREEDEED
jgi:two-component sensor histidine kinase